MDSDDAASPNRGSGRVRILHTDVTDDEALATAIAHAPSQLGDVNILMNSARS